MPQHTKYSIKSFSYMVLTVREKISAKMTIFGFLTVFNREPKSLLPEPDFLAKAPFSASCCSSMVVVENNPELKISSAASMLKEQQRPMSVGYILKTAEQGNSTPFHLHNLIIAVSRSLRLVTFATSKHGKYELHKIWRCSFFKAAFLLELLKCGQVWRLGSLAHAHEEPS